jgi:hypothetical protein
MKMPVRVWKEVVKIQRKFLWGGIRNGNKLCWVRWDIVTKPKFEGGLGVRDLRLVNTSLLAKWRWRLLSNVGEVWKMTLDAKYGNYSPGVMLDEEVGVGREASSWWKSVSLIDGDARWFINSVRKKIGNGASTRFWRDIWVGNLPLMDVFPRLFSVSVSKEISVAEARVQVDGLWCWKVDWRRVLFDWELDLYHNLLEVIGGVVLSEEGDRWIWAEDGDGNFSVKSCYNMLVRLETPALLPTGLENSTFLRNWKSSAPSKVCAFAWQVFLDRIPSRVNLAFRGVIKPPESKACILCQRTDESTTHLLLHCSFASSVWYALFSWLGFSFILPPDLSIGFASMAGLGGSKRRKTALLLLWQVTIWVIWRTRNDRLFNNKEASVIDVVDSIKHLTWRWYLGRIAKQPCLLYEWLQEPLYCMGL